MGEPGADDLRERSFVFRLGAELRPRLEHAMGPTIDVDYRNAGAAPKPGMFLNQLGQHSPIEVDLLLHDRGGDNYFCAEVKLNRLPATPPDPIDQLKILYLLERHTNGNQVSRIPPSPYNLGAIVHCRFPPGGGFETTVRWYLPGTPLANFAPAQGEALQQRRARVEHCFGGAPWASAEETWNFANGGRPPAAPNQLPNVVVVP